jgi:hypothetical protein
MTAHDVAQTLWAVGVLRWEHGGLDVAMRGAMEGAVARTHAGMTAGQLSETARILRQLGWQPDRRGIGAMLTGDCDSDAGSDTCHRDWNGLSPALALEPD